MLKKLTFNKYFLLVFFFGSSSWSPDGIYAASKPPHMMLNGFVMQSYGKTDSNNFLGDTSSARGSLDYTEIGVNGFLKFSPKLQLASQLLSRRAGKIDDGMPKLDYALVDYRVLDNQKHGLGFRVGRVKNPFGFYNETRDVSFTRENIILPQSIYFERTRDVTISSDSVHIYGHKQMAFGLIGGQLGAGLPLASGENTEYALFGVNRPGEFSGKPSLIGRVNFELDNLGILAAYSYVNLNMEYKPHASESALLNRNGLVNFEAHVFSIKYNLIKWSFTGEYAQRKMSSDGLRVSSVVNNKTGESFYAQAVYRVSKRWRVISRYDVLYADILDRNGNEFSKATLQANYSRFAKDAVLGVQFNINRSWMSRMELHLIDGTAWLPIQDNLDSSAVVRKWRMFNASVSYRF